MKTLQKKDAMEQFIEDMQAVLARSYAQQRSEMIKRRMTNKVAKGYSMARPPLGYSQTDVKGLYKPNALGECIGSILQTFTEDKISLDESLRYLKVLMSAHEKRTPNRERVVKLMLNPYYAGFVKWNGKTYEGLHEPIITEEIHNSVVRKIPFWAFPDKSVGN